MTPQSSCLCTASLLFKLQHPFLYMFVLPGPHQVPSPFLKAWMHQQRKGSAQQIWVHGISVLWDILAATLWKAGVVILLASSILSPWYALLSRVLYRFEFVGLEIDRDCAYQLQQWRMLGVAWLLLQSTTSSIIINNRPCILKFEAHRTSEGSGDAWLRFAQG